MMVFLRYKISSL